MKTWIIVSVVVAVLLVLIFGGDAVSYVSTALRLTRDQANETIPSSFHINRARDLAQKLEQEIGGLLRKFSAEQLRIEGLEKMEADGRDVAALAKLRDQILALRRELKAAPAKPAEVQKSEKKETQASDGPEQRLASLFKQYRAREDAIKARHQAIVIGRKALAQIEDRLRLLRADQDRLSSEILRIEAKLELAKSNGARPDAFDSDTRTRIDEILTSVETRIDIAERTELNKKELAMETSATAEASPEQIADTVDQYFKESSSGK